jgi:hypothetical protein
VLQDLLDDIRILDRPVRRIGDDPDRATTLFTLLYINGEDTLEPLRPSEGGPVLSKSSVSDFLVLLQLFAERHTHAVSYSAEGRPKSTRRDNA